jgi:hypothetical protein
MWAPTSAFGDVMDLWSVELTEGGARIGDQSVPVTTREEVIAIRGGQAESIVVREVPGYGVLFDPSFAGVPVPLTSEGREVLLGWTGFRPEPLYFLELDRAEASGSSTRRCNGRRSSATTGSAPTPTTSSIA